MFPTFSWSRSRASWSPTAFMSVLCSADVTYMCMSRNLGEGLMVYGYMDIYGYMYGYMEIYGDIFQFVHLLIAPPCSACSISSCERSLTNHSKLFWSLLIQKKST